MEAKDLIGLAVGLIVSLGVIGLSIPLLLGKGSWMIAGYNTMDPKKRERWDGPALCRFTGKVVLVIGIATLLYIVALFCFDLPWLTWIYLVLVIGLAVFAAVWCNTGGRFQK